MNPLSIGEQEALFEKHAKRAALAMGAYLHRHSERLCDLAKTRLLTLGVDEYGDRAWHLDRDRVKVEIDEELADGLFYNAVLRARDSGDLT